MADNRDFTIYSGDELSESKSLVISDLEKDSLHNLLFDGRIFDNHEYLVEPKDIRDALLTVGSNILFKRTRIGDDNDSNNNNLYYIGIDTLNKTETSRGLSDYPIVFGNRFTETEGVDMDQIHDASSSDIYLKSTGKNPDHKTKISILGGNTSRSWDRSPYMQSQVLPDGERTLDLVSNNDLNIKSWDVYKIDPNSPDPNDPDLIIDYTGVVSISGNILPSEFNSPSEDNVLMGGADNILTWGDIIYGDNDYGDTDNPLDIKGSDVLLNGISLYHQCDWVVPSGVGFIPSGANLKGMFAGDVLEWLIYGDKLRTVAEIWTDSIYFEYGSFPTPTVHFRIRKRGVDIDFIGFVNVDVDKQYHPIDDLTFITIEDSGIGRVNHPFIYETTFGINIVEKGRYLRDEEGDPIQVSCKIEPVYPIFHGVEGGELNKIVHKGFENNIYIIGEGNYSVYVYEEDGYPELSGIVDKTFTEEVDVVMSSPDGYWNNIPYKKYTFYNNTDDMVSIKLEW